MTSRLSELKRLFDLGRADLDRLAALAPRIEPMLPDVAERFYDEMLRHPAARAVFTGGEEQIKRQHRLLHAWMVELFAGTCDAEYFERRSNIGRTHVRVALPQHFMVWGMEIIWRHLREAVAAAAPAPEETEELQAVVHKLLMFDLGVMLDTYKEGYSQQVRQTERDLVEERLTRAEHLAEIGHLGASLAHEIKNPLAGISGAIQVIRDGLGEADHRRGILEEILAQIRRLDAAVRDLLLYARPAAPQVEHCALDDLVRRVLVVLREEPAMQRVRVDHGAGFRRVAVQADAGQLEQLLINLIINAAHASHEGGVIRLATESDTSWVELVVQDSGRGMPDTVRQRAFEPFFTTKAKGTGLGLSICRRIVEAHRGQIFLDSREGKGTTVRVRLPRRPGLAQGEETTIYE